MLPSAGAGLRPRTTPRSSGTTSPVGSRSPPSGGRSTRRGSCGATRWWHTRHWGDAGGVRWPSGQLTARTVGAVPCERCAGRKVVEPSWSSCAGRASSPARARCAARTAYGSWCGCPPRCAPRAAGRARRCRSAGRCRRRGGGRGCAAAGRRDPWPRGSRPGSRRSCRSTGCGASASCAAGAGAGRVEIGLSSTRWARDHAADEPAGGGELVGVGAAVEAQHAARARPSVRDPAPRERVVEAPEVKSTTASPGGSPSKAFSTIARTRSTTVEPGGRGHGQHVPDLLDDLLVAGIGEQHPVGTTADQHTSPTGVPRIDDQRRLPSYAPTPSIITHHTRPAHAVATCRMLGSLHTVLWVTAAGARHSWGQGGIGVARATFVRRHRVGIASGVALAIASAAVVGVRRHRERLQEARGRAQRRRHLGRQRQEGLVRPAQQADQPARRRRARARTARPGSTSSRTAPSVVTLDLNSARGQAIETSRLSCRTAGRRPSRRRRPSGWRGGTLASADPETGEVWAVRYDDEVGKPVMSSVDRQSEALAEAGEDAALAVSQARHHHRRRRPPTAR